MPKIFTSKTRKIGEIGENIAVRFLVKHNYRIIERNYTKKWGEIDIIATKNNKLHFVEVKSVSSTVAKALVDRREDSSNVSHETDSYRPEDNMHPWKLKRISRTLQTYLMSDRKLEDAEWQVDLLVVYIDIKSKKARIRMIEDIVL